MKKVDFKDKWLNTFGKELLQEYKDYNYLWEVFFLKPKNIFLCGIEATKEFNKVDRKNAISIEMWFEEETNEYDEKHYDDVIFSQGEDEGSIPELFIVSKDWSWTYVCSHEDDNDENGPFFMYNENR